MANTLADHHVNILACTSQTSTDRVARFRFDFELADPGHLDSIIAAIKRVDSIYEVSRVLPGHAEQLDSPERSLAERPAQERWVARCR